MAENLNYDASGSKCYDNNKANCATYGRLYNWETAMTVCPSGWHLPSQAEWSILTELVGGDFTEGRVLKAKTGWNNNDSYDSEGTDAYGFSAMPGGYVDSDGNFCNVGSNGNWWAFTKVFSEDAYPSRAMTYLAWSAWWDFRVKSYLYSVRCLQD